MGRSPAPRRKSAVVQPALTELVAEVPRKTGTLRRIEEKLRAMSDGDVPDTGDLVWLAFDPWAGREQVRRRPALVLSPKVYNAKGGLALVRPLPPQAKGYPFEVAIPADAGVGGAYFQISAPETVAIVLPKLAPPLGCSARSPVHAAISPERLIRI